MVERDLADGMTRDEAAVILNAMYVNRMRVNRAKNMLEIKIASDEMDFSPQISVISHLLSPFMVVDNYQMEDSIAGMIHTRSCSLDLLDMEALAERVNFAGSEQFRKALGKK
jgi:hypothetical protein